MHHLKSLLESSSPGDCLHSLHVVSAPTGPLGIPNTDDLQVAIYAIAPDETVPSIQMFIANVIAAAAIECRNEQRTVVWAGLSQEAWAVVTDDPASDALATQMRRNGVSLENHPDATEVTIAYAAAADGRRWTGQRWLTGPKAGETEDVRLIVGEPSPNEGFSYASRLLRKLVGIHQ